MSQYTLLIQGHRRPFVVGEEPSLDEPGARERGMLRELLKRAINDAVSGDETDGVGLKSEKRDAREWIFENELIGPFSFYWVCDNLDLEPSNLRDKVTQLIEKADRVRTKEARRPRSDWVYYLNSVSDPIDKTAA